MLGPADPDRTRAGTAASRSRRGSFSRSRRGSLSRRFSLAPEEVVEKLDDVRLHDNDRLAAALSKEPADRTHDDLKRLASYLQVTRQWPLNRSW